MGDGSVGRGDGWCSMRPRRARAWDRFIVSTAVGALAAAAVLFASEAKADVVTDYVASNARIVCLVLDEYPTVEGIQGVGEAIVEDGLSPRAAGEVIARSVIALCPEHLRELHLFVARWNGVQS